MKLVNEKGKLFGLINVVDLCCLLIILLVVAGFGWKILGSQVQNTVAPMAEMTSTFRIRGAHPYMLDDLKKEDFVGQKLVMGTGYVDAVIEDMYIEPYIVQAVTDDGRVVDAEDPSKRDVIIVVKSKIASGAPILKIGTQEVRTGRTFTLKTRTFETNALVDSVVVDD